MKLCPQDRINVIVTEVGSLSQGDLKASTCQSPTFFSLTVSLSTSSKKALVDAGPWPWNS